MARRGHRECERLSPPLPAPPTGGWVLAIWGVRREGEPPITQIAQMEGDGESGELREAREVEGMEVSGGG